MKIKFCPKCKGTRIIMVAGGKMGLSECVKCRFRSTIFPEIEQERKEKNESISSKHREI